MLFFVFTDAVAEFYKSGMCHVSLAVEYSRTDENICLTYQFCNFTNPHVTTVTMNPKMFKISPHFLNKTYITLATIFTILDILTLK
jgi:hypothetical protein